MTWMACFLSCEESLKEELSQLRQQMQLIRREQSELRELIRTAEHDSAKKDKLLQASFNRL